MNGATQDQMDKLAWCPYMGMWVVPAEWWVYTPERLWASVIPDPSLYRGTWRSSVCL